MMAFRTVLFALLMISLYLAVGDSSPSIASGDVSETEKTESSLHHHQQRLLLLRRSKREKKKDEIKIQFRSKLRWENLESSEPMILSHENAPTDFFLFIDVNCVPSSCDNIQTCPSTNMILVNPDNFEVLEWKKIKSGKLPPFAVETCNGNFIAIKEKGEIGYVRVKNKKQRPKKDKTNPKQFSIKNKNIEILTLNYNIAEEYLTNVKFEEKVQRDKKPAMFRNITVANNNCQPMKQQVKVDSGSVEASTYQSGSSLLLEGTAGINIMGVVDLGFKVDRTVSTTKTESATKTADQGYTQEIQVPATSSCNLVIASSAIITSVPFIGDLIRVYDEDGVRTTSINGTYTYQESTEIKTTFEQCTKLQVKCAP